MEQDPELVNDQHHLAKYEAFCTLYGIEEVKTVVKMYDIYELVSFLPAFPSESDKEALQGIIGASAASGYMDYARSTNTFELIMQWQEKTGKFDQHAIKFKDLNTEG